MNEGLVSIVVPVYNMQQYLSKSIPSLVNQTYRNLEILLIDDGSTDSSREICMQYAQLYPSLVRVVVRENGGLSAARNTGIDEAKGKYIIFPDPDDWAEREYIQRLVELIEQDHADLSCVGHYIDYERKTVIPNEACSLRRMDGTEARWALIAKPCIEGFAWNKMYRLDRIREEELYFLNDVGTTEDLDFAYRYLKNAKRVIFAPEYVLYHYVQRPTSASQLNYSPKQVQGIHSYEKILEDETADSTMVKLAKEEIFNVALNLLYALKSEQEEDHNVQAYLERCLKENLKYYLSSKNYGMGRKVQGILAAFCPDVYQAIKNMRRSK